MNSIVFVNVDTQKDFMNSDGALYVEGAEAIKSNLQALTELARENNIIIVNTADWHTSKSAELSTAPDFQKTFPFHCLANSNGAKFIDETQPVNPLIIDCNNNESYGPRIDCAKEIVIRKDGFNVFESNPNAAFVFSVIKPELCLLYGVAGDYCVRYVEEGLSKMGIKTALVTNAIRSINQ